MSRAERPALTVGSLIESDRGINLVCKCGHKTSLLPAHVATMAHPAVRLLDFKRRFRCSMCGRSGASADIKLSVFAVAAPFSVKGDAHVVRTPPRRPQ